MLENRTRSETMNGSAKKYVLRGMPLLMCFALLNTSPASAQVAGADQGIFNDEEQMLRINNAQVQQYQAQKAEAERELNAEDSKNATYRLYAEKKVNDLTRAAATATGAKKTDDQTQLQFFKDWLKRDAAYKARQMAYINQLQQTINSVQQGQQQTLSNLGSDITAMRETVQDKKDAQKFNQMMQINYFNELQSEMGTASWGRPPTDGTFNSVGGYGMLGGYGYGMGAGRRNYW
jgi:hypothetical protein